MDFVVIADCPPQPSPAALLQGRVKMDFVVMGLPSLTLLRTARKGGDLRKSSYVSAIRVGVINRSPY